MVACELLASCARAPSAPPSCAAPVAGFWRFDDPVMRASLRSDIEPPAIDTVRIARRGQIMWNGVPLGGLTDLSPHDVLDNYLRLSAKLEPQPFTALDFDKGVACGDVRRVREAMERHLACSTSLRCFQGAVPADSPWRR